MALTPEQQEVDAAMGVAQFLYEREQRHLQRIAELEQDIEGLKAQVEYERRARIDANNFPRNRYGYIPCMKCGIDCGMDAILPNDVWAQIAPLPDWPEAGMLCLWCMDEALVEKGVTGPIPVKVYFVGKILVSARAALDGEETT